MLLHPHKVLTRYTTPCPRPVCCMRWLQAAAWARRAQPPHGPGAQVGSGSACSVSGSPVIESDRQRDNVALTTFRYQLFVIVMHSV